MILVRAMPLARMAMISFVLLKLPRQYKIAKRTAKGMVMERISGSRMI